jgi:2-oxoglutarate dehydrogenase E2 component (dihydrolipoamide succinyltransferase)
MPEIRIPDLAESITEGTIAQWLVKSGDRINKGNPVIELETDKVNIEVISEYRGVLTEVKYEKGDTVKVGDVIAIVEELEDLEEQPAPKNHRNSFIKRGVVASPAARKLAREKEIDLNEVSAIDPFGRIRVQDVYNNKHEKNKSVEIETSTESDEGTKGEESLIERIKMTQRRQIIAKRLVEVQHTAAMLTTFNEINMTNVLDLRKRKQEQFYQENHVKLGFMSFFIKAAVAALKKYPLLNAEIRGDEMLLKKYYDIGVAVAADEGLVVPVIRDADQKNFGEIEMGVEELAKKARQNRLTLQDIQDGTFTITNGGIFGSLFSTPILNGSQVGILGMHTIQNRPVAIDKERMKNCPMMYIALSYDHRIVDGKEAVSFLKYIKELIEEPESLLFQI